LTQHFLSPRINYYHAQLDKELSKYPALQQLEARTQVPKTYTVLGVLGLFTSLIFFNIFAGFLSNFLGWLIPSYFSMKAIDTPQNGDDIQWLTYWMVSFFSSDES
jgi:receptor expression-enhancing protein 5/6